MDNATDCYTLLTLDEQFWYQKGRMQAGNFTVLIKNNILPKDVINRRRIWLCVFFRLYK